MLQATCWVCDLLQYVLCVVSACVERVSWTVLVAARYASKFWPWTPGCKPTRYSCKLYNKREGSPTPHYMTYTCFVCVCHIQNIVKQYMSLTLGKRVIWSRIENKHVMIIKDDGFDLTTVATSLWNVMASLLFRMVGEMICTGISCLNMHFAPEPMVHT